MKKILFVLCIVGAGLILPRDLTGEAGSVYGAMERLLGPHKSIVFVVGKSRLIVWKRPEVRDAIFIMDITGLRERTEKNFSSFPAYLINSNGAETLFSKTYQCSWEKSWERNAFVLYRCGLGMNHPPGIREAPTPGALWFFEALKRRIAPAPQVELAKVIFIEETPRAKALASFFSLPQT